MPGGAAPTVFEVGVAKGHQVGHNVGKHLPTPAVLVKTEEVCKPKPPKKRPLNLMRQTAS